jgi:hypothetical protein
MNPRLLRVVPTTVTLSQISFSLFEHSKGKSLFHHATFRLLLCIAVKTSFCDSTGRSSGR